ncbi:hypothetical protein B0H14DRAFT_2616261 [Mycena olivaceomarginata]|nr:hypothetical protein B0H14DRAFT_2616261 [Mycena olivaceomarginata]
MHSHSGQKCPNPDFWRFAHETQSVLVYGAIPQYSVLASIPILRIIDNLPSYCLRSPSAIPPKAPIDRVAWTYPIPKPNYRTFCKAQAATFLQASPEVRFRDSTAGSVRLALVFLTAWFQWMLQLHPPPENDSTIFYDAAVTKVSELAHAIALWPAASETIEIWDSVIREIALLVAEHVKPPRLVTGAEIVPENPPAPTRDHKFGFSGDVSIPTVLNPRSYLHTPPPTPPPALMAPFPRAAERSSKPHPAALSPPHPHIDTGADKCLQVSDVSHSQIDPPAPIPATSPRTEKPKPVAAETPPEVAFPAAAVLDVPTSSPTHPHLHSMGETASCLLTGFFFGALIIIVLSQRRPTLIHLS